MSIVKNIAAIAKGMSITLREGFQPTEVENYPDGKGPLRGAVLQERFRGKHQLQRDENGLEKCVACFLCAAACPANCIYIEAAENTEEVRISSAERYAKVYNIDYNRCIFCGYCVEACPTDAITHGHGFELASLNATGMVMRKEDLLVQVQLTANREQGLGRKSRERRAFGARCVAIGRVRLPRREIGNGEQTTASAGKGS
jgi:NADH-quinone oxidoreductase subunit I